MGLRINQGSGIWLGDGAPAPTGIYLPPRWGDRWKSARNQHASQPVSIVGWGDSIMQGYYSGNFRTESMFGKLVTDLKTLYSDGGSGYLSVINTTGIGSAGATYITKTGTWTNNVWAINEAAINPSTNATGSSHNLTFTGVVGSTIVVWYIRSTAASQDFTVAIDGGAPATVNAGGQPSILLQSVSYTPGAGSHAVVINATAGVPIICGVEGRNTTGIIGHNMGVLGRSSGAGAVTSFVDAGKTSGEVSITDFAPALAIFDMGGNDIVGVPAVDFVKNMARLFKLAKKHNDGNCEIIFVGVHIGSSADANNLYAQYMSDMRGLCESFEAAFVNFWPRGQNSWDFWNDLGYWGVTGGATGASGTDGVHPSNLGFAEMADTLKALLIA